MTGACTIEVGAGARAQDALGLTSSEAAARLVEYGHNEIHREEATSPWIILASQFKSPVIWLLLGACVISASLGEICH